MSNLNVIQVKNSHIRHVVDYRTYRPLNKSQDYDAKLAAQTGKCIKGKENIMKPCLFDDNDLIKTLRFLDELKRS